MIPPTFPPPLQSHPPTTNRPTDRLVHQEPQDGDNGDEADVVPGHYHQHRPVARIQRPASQAVDHAAQDGNPAGVAQRGHVTQAASGQRQQSMAALEVAA